VPHIIFGSEEGSGPYYWFPARRELIPIHNFAAHAHAIRGTSPDSRPEGGTAPEAGATSGGGAEPAELEAEAATAGATAGNVS
jgi:hypothetical protein